MCGDKNPYEGIIAKNLGEMKIISQKAREFDSRTGARLVWVDLKSGREIATNV